MANYTAADIKALRERTGAGMLDVKKALVEADGDQTKAVEILRIKGLKGVTKREGRQATNGLVTAHTSGTFGTMIELACETDFVAKSAPFIALADKVLAIAVATEATDTRSLLHADLDGRSVQEIVDEANATIGEKIEVRRVARVHGETVVKYLHKTSPDLPAQIGVLLAVTGEHEAAARDIAMHIAAFSPTALSRKDIPEAVLAKERELAEATAREEGKPEQALERIIEGRVQGFLKDNVLLEQPHAKEPKKTVAAVAQEAGLTVTGFARFKVGV